jgi:tRNA (guanine-N7-)-methyltransferase
MKPTDLVVPQDWTERKVALSENILFLPDYYDKYHEYQLPSWSEEVLFGNSNPIYIEYCSGNGQWIVERAKASPHINWVAVEKWLPRVRKIWAKGKCANLKNLFIVAGEAYTFSRYYVQKDSISEVFVNFPDPWPKTRHAKHRLIRLEFVEELYRILQKSGHINLVTDDTSYAQSMIKTLLEQKKFISEYPEPYYRHDITDYGDSYFDNLWRTQHKKIHYIRMAK